MTGVVVPRGYTFVILGLCNPVSPTMSNHHLPRRRSSSQSHVRANRVGYSQYADDEIAHTIIDLNGVNRYMETILSNWEHFLRGVHDGRDGRTRIDETVELLQRHLVFFRTGHAFKAVYDKHSERAMLEHRNLYIQGFIKLQKTLSDLDKMAYDQLCNAAKCEFHSPEPPIDLSLTGHVTEVHGLRVMEDSLRVKLLVAVDHEERHRAELRRTVAMHQSTAYQ